MSWGKTLRSKMRFGPNNILERRKQIVGQGFPIRQMMQLMCLLRKEKQAHLFQNIVDVNGVFGGIEKSCTVQYIVFNLKMRYIR
jgi:hypothetical protein